MGRTENGWRGKSCLGRRMQIALPEDLKEPSAELLEKRFPYEQKPQEVYMNSDGRKIITFNLLEKRLKENQIYAAVGEIQKMINHIYPESIRERTRSINTGSGRIGWFSYITGGVAEDNYHIMFLLPIDEKMMFGSYHFPLGQLEDEKKTFLDIITSIEVR